MSHDSDSSKAVLYDETHCQITLENMTQARYKNASDSSVHSLGLSPGNTVSLWTEAKQAEYFCNSIGILQQYSTPSRFPGFERSGAQTQQQQEDYAQLFATLIVKNAKDIDTLIDTLPNEESSTDLQVVSLKRLEQENQEAHERLEEVVCRGEELLEKIQAALADIAQSQLDMQHISITPGSGNENGGQPDIGRSGESKGS